MNQSQRILEAMGEGDSVGKDAVEVLFVGDARQAAKEASKRGIPFVFMREIHKRGTGAEAPGVETLGRVSKDFMPDLEKWRDETQQTWAGIHKPGSLLIKVGKVFK